jgi:hypothetical protein
MVESTDLQEYIYDVYYYHGVEILDIGVWSSQPGAQFWKTSQGLTFPVLYDAEGTTSAMFTISNITPHTCVVDDEQILMYSHLGYVEDETIWEIEDLLVSLFNPELVSDTESIDFGEVEVGSSADMTVILTNGRTGVITVNDISVTGEPYSVGYTGNEIYAVESELEVTVTFAPTESGAFEDILDIQTDAGNLSIPISGNAPNYVRPHNDVIPAEFALLPNHPNPFNAMTTFEFALPNSAEVLIEIYDIYGGMVSNINAGTLNPGMHSLNFDAGDLTSGVYFYKLTASSQSAIGKMVLVK